MSKGKDRSNSKVKSKKDKITNRHKVEGRYIKEVR